MSAVETEVRGARGRGASSTTSDVPPPSRSDQVGIWFRRLFLALLLVVVIAGVSGFLGVKARTVTADSRSGDVTLEVHYAQVARAGLEVPFVITVQRHGGFTGQDEVVLAVSSSYLDLFNRSSVDPQPRSESATASTLRWHFDPPPGDTLTISVDLQVGFGRHWGRAGTVAVLDHGRRVVSTSFKTWLAP